MSEQIFDSETSYKKHLQIYSLDKKKTSLALCNL